MSEAHRNDSRSASSGGPSHRVDGPTQSDGGGAAEPISIAWAGAVLGRAFNFDSQDLPETGPQGRIYRQLGDEPTVTRSARPAPMLGSGVRNLS